jgi:hypothetical protein
MTHINIDWQQLKNTRGRKISTRLLENMVALNLLLKQEQFDYCTQLFPTGTIAASDMKTCDASMHRLFLCQNGQSSGQLVPVNDRKTSFQNGTLRLTGQLKLSS